MNLRRIDRRRQGFTLLELVIVLVILALVTTLAFRSLDGVEDQRRYEASREMLEDIEKAVLGESDTAGFISDMGRLPKTVLVDGELQLAELWSNILSAPALPLYDVIQAKSANLVSPSATPDDEIYVPGGWRGPYLHMPPDAGLGASAPRLRDGWGNPMHSFVEPNTLDPNSTGYCRLRVSEATPINTAGVEVQFIKHLGANGTLGATDRGDDRDLYLALGSSAPVNVTSTIQVVDGDGNRKEMTTQVFLRVFSPLEVVGEMKVQVNQASVTPSPPTPPATYPSSATLTTTSSRGLRAVRAYEASGAKSAIKYVTLRPGANFIPLTIYRP